VLLLACAALTAGDLEAAVALYEPDAVLSWGPDRAAVGQAAIRGVLAEAMNMRLPLRGRTDSVLVAGNLALITGERSMRGTGPDGVAIALAGPATLIVRRRPDGTWLTVADEWNPLSGTGGSVSPGERPPGTPDGQKALLAPGERPPGGQKAPVTSSPGPWP
jgi:ketosteroid isomerase-like protein